MSVGKNAMRGILVLACAFVFLFAGSGAVGYANADEGATSQFANTTADVAGASSPTAAQQSDEAPSPVDLQNDEVEGGSVGGASQLAPQQSIEVPSSFDLRNVDTDGDGVGDTSYVTPVRSQYPFGICWGFAAMAAAETSLLEEGFERDPNTLNLSEKHLAYFAHWHLDDSSDSQHGEGMYIHDEQMKDGIQADDIYAGGSAFLATNTFATGMGPVSEYGDPVLEYRGANGIIVQEQAPDGSLYDFSYSKDDDWSIDEQHRFSQDYLLRESYLLPSPASSAEDESGSIVYVYDETATEVLKEQLLQHRAVVIGFHADTSRPWQRADGEGRYMDITNWAHYTWDNVGANHAVTIIGWDDGYSASNFPEGEYADSQTGKTVTRVRPPGDGAWLAKNSWGAGTNEFPDRGTGLWGIPVQKTDENGNPVLDENGDPVMVGSGYFWLSYNDQSISNPEVLIFGKTLSSKDMFYSFEPNELIRDQYDFMPVTSLTAWESSSQLQLANVFTAEQSKNVMCVSYEIAMPNTTVSYEVYLLAPDYESPTDGVLVAGDTTTYEHAGFYMSFFIPMATVQEGQSYSIVVTQQGEDGTYYANMPMSQGKNSRTRDLTSELAAPQYAVAVVNQGESLINKDGAWKDWSNKDVVLGIDSVQMPILYEYLDAQFDNFPIKGYAIAKQEGVPDVRLADGVESAVLHVGDNPMTLSLEFFGDGADVFELDGRPVRWYLMDDAGNLVKVEASGDGTQADLTGLAEGKTRLVASVADVGTIIVPVKVLPAHELDPTPEPSPSPVDNPVIGGADVGGKARTSVYTTMPKTGDDGTVVCCLMVLSVLGLAGMTLAFRKTQVLK